MVKVPEISKEMFTQLYVIKEGLASQVSNLESLNEGSLKDVATLQRVTDNTDAFFFIGFILDTGNAEKFFRKNT